MCRHFEVNEMPIVIMNKDTHLASLAVNHGNMVYVLLQPAVNVVAKLANHVERRRVVVIKRKVFNTAVEFGLVVRALRTSTIHSTKFMMGFLSIKNLQRYCCSKILSIHHWLGTA